MNEKELRKIILLIVLLTLAVLTFIILRPIMMSICAGLLLAYIFYPLQKQLVKLVKRPGIAALIVCFLVILLIIVPLWFLVPPIMQQVFDTFQYSQQVNVQAFVKSILPTASDQFVSQIVTTANAGISKGASAVLNFLVDFLLDFPTYTLHFVLLAFVFFYALKDQEKLKEFGAQISPFNKSQNKALVKQFRDMTDSIIYGHILVGIYQGIAAGIGLLIFGVPKSLILTIIAMIFSVLPIVGPAIVYVPATFYIMSTAGLVPALIYLAYNLIVVSSFDNLIRAHLVARRTDISQVFIVVGMIGGLIVFGILGLVIGPLIIGYFLAILKAYRDKTLVGMFNPNEEKKQDN